MSDAVLGIDGALGPFSVALVSRSGAFPPRALAGRGHDALERGLGLLHELLGPLAPSALERIVVTTGPGSFAGLRIAASYAKSLAFAAGVPLVGVGSFDVLDPPDAAAAREAPGDARTAALAVVPSRSGHVNARLRTAGGLAFSGGPIDDVAAEIARRLEPGATLHATGASAGVLAALAERNIHVISVPLSVPYALAAARLGLDRSPLASPHALVAEYGLDGPATVAPPKPA